jgi:hypothetical protein
MVTLCGRWDQNGGAVSAASSGRIKLAGRTQPGIGGRNLVNFNVCGDLLYLQHVTLTRHHLVQNRVHEEAQKQSRDEPGNYYDRKRFLRVTTDSGR